LVSRSTRSAATPLAMGGSPLVSLIMHLSRF
jgi:hypothetical protein